MVRVGCHAREHHEAVALQRRLLPPLVTRTSVVEAAGIHQAATGAGEAWPPPPT